MKSCLILCAVLVPLVAPHAAMPAPQKGGPTVASASPSAASRPAGPRQLSAEERAVLRRQLYQYRTQGKNS